MKNQRVSLILRKIFYAFIGIILVIGIIQLAAFFFFIYTLFKLDQGNPNLANHYQANKKAIQTLEETYDTIIGLTSEQILELLGEPDGSYQEDDGYLFLLYHDFSEEQADQYFCYKVGGSLFSDRIYLIGFHNGIVVGAKYTVEDW